MSEEIAYVACELDFRKRWNLSIERILFDIPKKNVYRLEELLREAENAERLYDSSHVYPILDKVGAINLVEEYRDEIAEDVILSRWVVH